MIFILVYFLTYAGPIFSSSNKKPSPTPTPTPLIIVERPEQQISPYCFDGLGQTLSVSGEIKNGPNALILRIGNTMYDASKFHKDPNTNIIFKEESVNYIFNYCKSKQAELDIEYMFLTHPETFGKTQAEQEKNTLILRGFKKDAKMDLYLPLNVIDNNGAPQRFLKEDKKYLLLQIDKKGLMSEESLQTVSSIRLKKIFLAVDQMMEKAQDLSSSGIKIDMGGLKNQFEGLQKLGELYTNNITSATTQIPLLKKYSYIELEQAVSKILNYFTYFTIGDTGPSDAPFSEIAQLYANTTKIVSEIRAIKDRVRTPFNEMYNLAKSLPGDEINGVEDFVNSPKKYTIPMRFVHDASGQDINTTKLFYICDEWWNQLENLQGKISAVQTVKQGFLPDLRKDISAISSQIASVQAQKKSFEEALQVSAQQGNMQDINGSVSKAKSVVEEKINEIITLYNKISASIESVKNVTDTLFQQSLSDIKKQFSLIAPKVEVEIIYKNEIPAKIQNAYKSADEQKKSSFTQLGNAVKEHITKLDTFLDPVKVELQDSTKNPVPTWSEKYANISYMVNVLRDDLSHSAQLLARTTDLDVDLKNFLKDLDQSIHLKLADIQSVGNQVEIKKMYFQYILSLDLVQKMTGSPVATPDSFPEALKQYQADKNINVLIAKYEKIKTITVQTKNTLEENWRKLNKMDQGLTEVKLLSDKIKPLISSTSSSYIIAVFNTHVNAKMPENNRPAPLL
ncbi:hypothetical protein [Holospora obtusa]|nr:hypothetical protein [Holospora obtusa]